jgi:hypothetical protein
MWPFHRKVEARPPGGPQPVPAPVIRRDWAGLAPIQRMIGAHPLTAPSDWFSNDLATHHDPSVSSDTMGHQVSADAPAGLVLALTRPTSRSDGPAMIPRPRVQRREVGAVAESGEWDGDEAAPEPARPTPVPASASMVAARELPAVAPEPAVQRLISLPPDAEPIPASPLPQRSRALPTPLALSRSFDEAEAAPAPTPRLTLGQSRKLGLGAPIRRVPDRSLQRAATETSSYPPPEGEAGARLPAPPAVSDTAPPPTSVPLSLSAPPPVVARSVDTTASTRPLEPTLRMAPVPPPDATDEPRSDLPLARRPASEPPSAGDGQVAPPALPVQTSPTSSPEPSNVSSMAPAPGQLGDDGASISGSIEGRPPLAAGNRTTVSMASVAISSLSLVPQSLSRPPTVGEASAPAAAATAPLVSARPLLTPTTHVQRSNEPDPAPLSAPLAGPPARGERESISVAESPLPAPFPDGEESSNWAADAADGPSFTRSDEMAPAMTLAQRASEHLPPSEGVEKAPAITLDKRGSEPQPSTWSRANSLPLAPSRGVAMQRVAQAVDDSDSGPSDVSLDPAAPMVQGAWYDSIAAGAKSLAANAAGSGAGAAAAGSAVSSVAAAPGQHHAPDTDMDELAGKLYDRIRNRLKTELLVDRERAGFLTDLR